ncbi:MAG: hypothetical protein FWC95_00475 [Defluviitaleaceae bacterium]|nr:hypothetical protein [Defluviitaleaceae bacterium]
MIALTIIGWILLGIIVLALFLTLLILLLPIHYSIAGQKKDKEHKWIIRIRIFFFLNIRLPRNKKRQIKQNPVSDNDIITAPSKIKRKKQTQLYLNPLKSNLRKHFLRLLLRLIKTIKPHKLDAYVEYGASDPANTGYILAILGILKSIWGDGLTFDGKFDEEIFRYKVRATGFFVLMPILISFLKFILSKPVRAKLKEHKRKKNGGKDKNGSKHNTKLNPNLEPNF